MGFMATLGRIPKILEANINDLLDKCEDPEKMIEQTLVDYKRNLVEVKKATAEVVADMNLAKQKLDECDNSIKRKTKAAERALQAGNEEDAKQLLASRSAEQVTREQLYKNYQACVNNANQMKAGYNKLVADIESLEQRANVAKTQMRTAKAQEKIHKTSAMANNAKLTDNFARYEAKAQSALAKANAMTELDEQVETADQIMQKYESSGSSAEVDAELEEMKKRLGIA